MRTKQRLVRAHRGDRRPGRRWCDTRRGVGL